MRKSSWHYLNSSYLDFCEGRSGQKILRMLLGMVEVLEDGTVGSRVGLAQDQSVGFYQRFGFYWMGTTCRQQSRGSWRSSAQLWQQCQKWALFYFKSCSQASRVLNSRMIRVQQFLHWLQFLVLRNFAIFLNSVQLYLLVHLPKFYRFLLKKTQNFTFYFSDHCTELLNSGILVLMQRLIRKGPLGRISVSWLARGLTYLKNRTFILAKVIQEHLFIIIHK